MAEELNPHRHIILYAKGHYTKAKSMFTDVKCILHALYPEEVVTTEKAMRVLAILAYGAISNVEHQLPRYKKGSIHTDTPTTQMSRFLDMFDFMYKAREDVAKEFTNINSAMEELIAQSLLVMTATHAYGDSELGAPDVSIQAAMYAGTY